MVMTQMISLVGSKLIINEKMDLIMFINVLDQIAMELATWDFLSIAALLATILGISQKFPFVGIGLSIFIYKILGSYWCAGFVMADVLLLMISWYQCNQIENAISAIGHEFDGVKEEVQRIREESQKIRKTLNPHDQYMDEHVDF